MGTDMFEDNVFRRLRARLVLLAVDESGMSTVEYSTEPYYILSRMRRLQENGLGLSPVRDHLEFRGLGREVAPAV